MEMIITAAKIMGVVIMILNFKEAAYVLGAPGRFIAEKFGLFGNEQIGPAVMSGVVLITGFITWDWTIIGAILVGIKAAGASALLAAGLKFLKTMLEKHGL